jgi:hypothetical protein
MVRVAAFAFAIHAVFSYLIVPAFRYAPTIFASLGVAWAQMSLADGIHAALQLLIGTLAAIVFIAVKRYVLAQSHRYTARQLTALRPTAGMRPLSILVRSLFGVADPANNP